MAVTIHRPLAVAGLFTLSMALAACSALRPPVDSVLESVPLPTQWYAPMYSMTSPSIASTTPHHNRTQESPPSSTAALIAWWEGFNDPLLVEWIRQAQAISPTIASAKARIESARATAVQTTTALFPTVAGTAQRSRSVTDRGSPTVDRLQSGFTLSWEIGVWGQSYAYFDGARANFEGSQATWHEARVLVAAEVAQRYFALRFCAPQLTLAREDQESRALTARQLASLAGAGFASPADHALANASAAEGVSRYAQQHARCESLNKSMVALTGIAEPELRVAVNKAESTSPIRADATLAPLVSVSAIPALTLAQRPDVYRAHRTLITAGANVGVARAALLPSISLQGTITHQRQTESGNITRTHPWSLGPLSIHLPLFNLPTLNAQADAAYSEYESAGMAFLGTVRNAVREVEVALVQMHSLKEQAEHAAIAAKGYDASFVATAAKHRAHLANIRELEEARRVKLAADSQWWNAALERVFAGIDFYKAVGGGFSPDTPITFPSAKTSPSVPASKSD